MRNKKQRQPIDKELLEANLNILGLLIAVGIILIFVFAALFIAYRASIQHAV